MAPGWPIPEAKLGTLPFIVGSREIALSLSLLAMTELKGIGGHAFGGCPAAAIVIFGVDRKSDGCYNKTKEQLILSSFVIT